MLEGSHSNSVQKDLTPVPGTNNRLNLKRRTIDQNSLNNRARVNLNSDMSNDGLLDQSKHVQRKSSSKI